MSVVDEYNLREKLWPCVLNESVGSALELRNGSQEVMREIEKIACDSTDFLKEWKEHPMVMRVRKIVSCIIYIYIYARDKLVTLLRVTIVKTIDYTERD